MKTRTITSMMVILVLVGMLSALVVGAASSEDPIEWLPPLTSHEEFAFTDGSTLPIKFRLLDGAGGSVIDPTVEVTVTSIGDILFSDDFDDGNFVGWTPVSDDYSWSVTETGELHTDGGVSYPRILADSTMSFTDYMFEADARLLVDVPYCGGCALLFRAGDHTKFYSYQYDPGLEPPEEVRMRLSRFVDWIEYYDPAANVSCPVPTVLYQWHHLKVEVVGPHIRCYIDGIKVFDVTDTPPETSPPPLAGGIGFRTWAYSAAEFDNVTVREIIEWESFSYADGTIDVSESIYHCNLHTKELGMPAGDYMISVWLEDRSVQVGSHPFQLVEPGKGRGKP